MKKNTQVMILAVLFIASIIGLYFFSGYLFPGCATCSWDWTSIGRLTSIKNGDTIDLGAKIVNYDSILLNNERTVIDIDKYQQCQFKLSKVEYYQQSGKYYVRIFEGSHGYSEEYGSGTTVYTCSSGVEVKLKPTPVNCNLTTNPDPKAYVEYKSCSGLAGLDIYIPNIDIRETQCSSGDTTVKTCDDGEVITTKTCVNELWKSTGQRCTTGSGSSSVPTPSGCTNICPVNYTRTAYPECICEPPPTSGACAEGALLYAMCPTGEKIITHQCKIGQYVATENECKVPETNTFEESEEDTIAPIIFGLIGLLVIVIIVAFVLGRGRKR